MTQSKYNKGTGQHSAINRAPQCSVVIMASAQQNNLITYLQAKLDSLRRLVNGGYKNPPNQLTLVLASKSHITTRRKNNETGKHRYHGHYRRQSGGWYDHF